MRKQAVWFAGILLASLLAWGSPAKAYDIFACPVVGTNPLQFAPCGSPSAPNLPVQLQDKSGNAVGSFDVGSVVTIATTSSAGTVETNNTGHGVVCVLNVSTLTGTSPTITFTLKGRDANGNNYTIGATTAISATGIYRIEARPGITVGSTSPNWTFSDAVPLNWHLDTTMGGTVTAAAGTTDCQYVN